MVRKFLVQIVNVYRGLWSFRYSSTRLFGIIRCCRFFIVVDNWVVAIAAESVTAVLKWAWGVLTEKKFAAPPIEGIPPGYVIVTAWYPDLSKPVDPKCHA